MRILKTALAVVLCVFVSKLLNLEYAFYASIAAIITMESTVSSSFKAGKNRMLGTLVGALVGFLCASILPGNALICGIGIIIVIYLCNLLKWSKSVSIACIVFLAIMVNLNGKNPVFYSINRIVDTFIGITIAVVINYFVFPPDNIKKIEKCYFSLVDNIEKLINNGISNIKESDLKTLSSSLNELEKDILLYESEFRIKKNKISEIGNINKVIKIQHNILSHLIVMKGLEGKYDLNLNDQYTKDKLDIIYNYNIEEIKNDLLEMEKLNLFVNNK